MSTYESIEIFPEDLESFEGCPVCGPSPVADKGDIEGGMRFVWCLTCGLFFMNPRPTDSFLQHFYDSEYWRATDADTTVLSRILRQFERSAVFLRLLSALNPGAENGRILEIGSGPGGVVWSMANILGLSPYANEPDLEARRILESLDIKMVSNEEIDAGGRDESFAVVVLSHVLEHQTNPKAFLERAIRLVAPGGVLLVEVPNGAVVRDGGIQHPVVFSRNSLSALVERLGFQYQLRTHAGRGKVALPPQYLVAIIRKIPLSPDRRRNRIRATSFLIRIGRTLSPRIRRTAVISIIDKLVGFRRRHSDEQTVRKLRVKLLEKLFSRNSGLD